MDSQAFVAQHWAKGWEADLTYANGELTWFA